MIRALVSAAFVDDRQGRGLDCGEVRASHVRGKVECLASPEVLSDMLDDAAYQGWHTDSDLAMRNAAQAAFRHLLILAPNLIPDYRKGTKIRNGRLIPGDA